MKKNLIQIAKLAVAALLIYWLIATKKITAEPFIQLWGTPWLTVFIFVIITTMIIINNYRWLLLLRGQKIHSSVKQTLPLTYIGLFFNLAMPGAVGGDLVKAFYIAQEQPGTKLRAATTVLIDRVVGLYAMALIAMAAIATHWDFIIGSLNLRGLAFFDLALASGFTVFFLFAFSSRVRAHDWTNSTLNSVPGGKFIEKIYDAVHAFKEGKRQFVLGVLLSIVVQSLNIVCFYVISRTLNYEVSLGSLFFVVPLGLMATAIPVSPGGLGVGQAVFVALFQWYSLSPTLGATLITIFQVAQAIVSVIGAYFYFTRKAEIKNLAANGAVE